MNIPEYDYSKLRGRIVEKCGTQRNFAKAMKWSLPTQTKKMAGRIPWNQNDVRTALDVLDIEKEEIPAYFFTAKVQN